MLTTTIVPMIQELEEISKKLSPSFGKKISHPLYKTQNMKKLINFSITNHIRKAYNCWELSIEENARPRTIFRNKALFRSTIVYTNDLITECLKGTHNTKKDIVVALELKKHLDKLIEIVDTGSLEKGETK